MNSLTTKIANEVINTANEAIRFFNSRATTGMLIYCEDTFTNLLRITEILAAEQPEGEGAELHNVLQQRLDAVLKGHEPELIEHSAL
ncbi:hypothetical protein MHM89_11360 [Pseudoalteromonas sp. CNC9-20]|uniref:hypothetical protein n=1 Tax=Pseudoalteromonas TaxID=53246 RepID=UPI00034A45DC|nr:MULTISPECIES: hypothetical protein [Pseudoalteromonas]MCG7570530.1 hypothetical protein [Pseudoalteromonas sp. CNC9-20]|tara:strand:+ start:56222 stop:56482 length:261 start_codon:yes stop_codon:yes gene_type:complete